MKRWIITIITVLVVGQVSNASAVNIPTNKPIHTIFLIHGIAGKGDHFGEMEKALANALNKNDPSQKYVVKSVEYETGNDEKNTYDFAKDINLQIMRVTASGKFSKQDRISLVMHSQGGIVGSIWMFQSLFGTRGFSTPETIEHLDSFITLGTPFWGAKSAEMGRNIDGFFNSLGIDLEVPFGTKELKDMSIGSDTVYDFRMALVASQYKKQVQYLKNNVRFLNIAATAKLLNPIGIFAAGGDDYEDDGAVLLPSARFNFLFNRSIKNDYELYDRVELKNTEEIDFAPFIAVDGLHRSPIPEIKELKDIVYIPKACIEDQNCEHPTFQYIWKHLLGQEVKSQQMEVSAFKSFLIDLNVSVSDKHEFECDDIKIKFSQLDGSSLDGSNVEISSFFELFSEGKNKSEKHPNQCRFYYTGIIKNPLKQKESILMQISGVGLKDRLVEVLLKPGYSSFVDINLIEENKEEE